MPGYTSVEVVGEAYRPDAFRRIFSGAAFNSDGGAEEYVPAVLSDDSANPHDGNAVAVWVKEQHVGYLDRDKARTWHPVVSDLAGRNQSMVVDARAWARDAGDRVHARVTLYMPPRDGVWPVNSLPTEPYVVLPRGGQIQVTQEDRHMDVLTAYARGRDVPVAVTLHAVTEQRPRSTVSVVEVRLDGQRVGLLSPTQTANLQPLIERVAGRGLQSVARALVRGNELKADVILFVTKAQDVDPVWLRFLDTQGQSPTS
ncbi:HIRAN domain-containing protein [Actinotalea sp. Marseille-Q4924]|uniref:HIRAN domain-containing protein n=1 Tax=Actinotalea sp. Marseille-Q4924 TaxID=2866571 RepID=UPI001CE3D3D7|nr:HIRAN domain-containing protein [Actinotalea sp. Marseille-Q4924]